MTSIKFKAPEYQADGSFSDTAYEFHGSESGGWEIIRAGHQTDTLGPGYVPIKSLFCGICSTDLARRYLPYPLPQVIGHEVVGLHESELVVVEINASHLARGSGWQDCPYCANEMSSQCPDRITLGIDRLSGGFAPYFLAPVNAVTKLPESISPLAGCLTEPLAAALQAVESSPPDSQDQVAVLGPRRLGMLVLAALLGFRKEMELDFEISAVVRHEALKEICLQMGADKVINLNKNSPDQLKRRFDIVYDTTGSEDGFAAALERSRRVVHLKSTTGQAVMGMHHLTDMVVDEMVLLPFSPGALEYTWPLESETRRNANIFVSPKIPKESLSKIKILRPDTNFIQADIDETARNLKDKSILLKKSLFPQFDLALAADLDEVDRIIRPIADESFSLVRPRGAILLLNVSRQYPDNELLNAISEYGIQIQTSRCGNFKRALQILENNPHLLSIIEEQFITHKFPLHQISQAFETAAESSRSIKVVIEISKQTD